jgi:hypothetical protein
MALAAQTAGRSHRLTSGGEAGPAFAEDLGWPRENEPEPDDK